MIYHWRRRDVSRLGTGKITLIKAWKGLYPRRDAAPRDIFDEKNTDVPCMWIALAPLVA
jgi:hypothetical protein